MRRYWPLLLMAILPLIPLHRAVFFGEAIGPFDQIRQMAPWNADAPEQPWDVLTADGVLQFTVWRDLVFEAWSRFDLPFWNPYQLAGTPLLANSQSGAFYPLHILAGLLQLPTYVAIALLAWFHLFWAGLGTFRLAQGLGASEAGAPIAGASFALSAFMTSWTPLASVITTVAWIPWCLTFAIPGDGKDEARRFAKLAACIGLMLLAGHLQFAAYGLGGAFLMALWHGIAREAGASKWALPVSIAAIAAGGLLSMPQLKPVLEYSEFSHRRNAPSEEGYAAYLGTALQPWELGTLAATTLYGHPHRFSTYEDTLPSYWPMLAKRGASFAESAIGPGPFVIALLALVPFAAISWRRAGGIGLLAAVGVLLALGTPLNRLLYFYAPGWSSTGSPGRAGVLFLLGACVLAGLVVGSLRERSHRPWLPVALALILVALLVAIPFRMVPKPDNIPAEAWSQLVASPPAPMLIALAMLAAIAGIAWLNAGKAAPQRASGPGLAALAVVVLALLHWDLVPTGKPLAPVRGADGERIAIVNEDWQIVQAGKALMPPNTASLFRIHELGGYDSLLHRDTVGMLNDANGQDSAPPANGNIMFVKPTADWEKLADAGVTQVWSRQPLANGGGPPVDGFHVYRLEGQGRVQTDAGPGEVVYEDLDTLRVRVDPASTTLVLKDRAMPGWTANGGGKELKISEGLWRGVQVPQGVTEVEFRYRPPGLASGLILGSAGLFAVLSAVLIGLGSGRRHRNHQPSDASSS